MTIASVTDHDIRVWRGKPPTAVFTSVAPSTSTPLSLAVSPTGRFVCAVLRSPGNDWRAEMKLWEIIDNQQASLRWSMPCMAIGRPALCFSAEEEQLFFVEECVRRIDVKSGRELAKFGPNAFRGGDWMCATNGNLLLGAVTDDHGRRAIQWVIETGEKTNSIGKSGTPLSIVSVCGDADRVAVARWNSPIAIWRVGIKKQVLQLAGFDGEITDMCISPGCWRFRCRCCFI